MNKREPLRSQYVGKADASGALTVFYPGNHALGENDELHLTRLIVSDDTSAGADATVSVLSPGQGIPVVKFGSMAAGALNALQYELVLTAGQNLKVDVSSATAGDAIRLIVDGYMIHNS